MSFDAIRWAMDQAVEPALTKFCLVTMAECVNADTAGMECWPSYAYLSKRTGMNTKTVESSVFRLKEQGYIVDTGKRAGDTGKVIVYRLNAPKNGGIQPGIQTPDANGTRPQNTTAIGVITSIEAGSVIPPNLAVNPPNSGDQSPQLVEEIPPKTGVGISKGKKRKKTNSAAAAGSLPTVDGVPADLLKDWLVVRNAKRAGPITPTVVAGIRREAGLAGITIEAAIRCCCERGWQGFKADWYTSNGGKPAAEVAQRQESFV